MSSPERLPEGDRDRPVPGAGVAELRERGMQLYQEHIPPPIPITLYGRRPQGYLTRKFNFELWVTGHVLVWGTLPPEEDLLFWIAHGRVRTPEEQGGPGGGQAEGFSP